MFLIVKLFFMVVGFFFLLTLVTGVSLAMRVRQHLVNPFLKPDNASPPPPPGNGDVIEGEFKVLDEKDR